jgi:IS5 family transposase
MKHQFGFFDESNRLQRLSSMGDPLVKIMQVINFEIFRPILDSVFKKEKKEKKNLGGRPQLDLIMMFKILLLQQWYGIADDKTEYQINDRLSFQRFLGLSLGSRVPDAKTIWLFREQLVKSGEEKSLFALFTDQMERKGIITRSGSIVDASFVEAPKQRNSRDENERIKSGEVPEEWKKSQHKLRQKDTDARWAKKNQENHYGYKNHVKMDKTSKLIVTYCVTDASVHDSREIVHLVEEQDQELYADSAYVGVELHEDIRKKNTDIKLKIHEKGYRNRPLTDEQKSSNREKSRVRARVEHVFGHMTKSMNGLIVRSIGICRARCSVGLQNLAYNMSRYQSLCFSGGVKTPA